MEYEQASHPLEIPNLILILFLSKCALYLYFYTVLWEDQDKIR